MHLIAERNLEVSVAIVPSACLLHPRIECSLVIVQYRLVTVHQPLQLCGERLPLPQQSYWVNKLCAVLVVRHPRLDLVQQVEPSQAAEGAVSSVRFLHVLYLLLHAHVGHPLQHGGTYELLLYQLRADNRTFRAFTLGMVDPVQIIASLLEFVHEELERPNLHPEVFGN